MVTASNNGYDGIEIAGTGASVSSNTADTNSSDGIQADGPDSNGDGGSSGNTFTSNGLANNLSYDAEDDTTGSKTAGTANTWKSNRCTPKGDASPEGICS